MKFGKILNKLTVALMATIFITISGLSSVCMAVKDTRNFEETCAHRIKANEYYASKMLESIPKEEGLKKSNQDGNYFKQDKLSDEEKKTYDEIVVQVNEIKESVYKDSSSELSYDCKLAKSIFFWVRNNIKYDEESVNEFDENGNEKINPNRKSQDALSVFKNRTGVCAGVADMSRLMLRIAGLPCMMISNSHHKFNSVWLESLNGWALFDATFAEVTKNYEENESKKSKSGMSPNDIGLINNFTAVSDTTNYTLQDNNAYFLAQGVGDHYVYRVFDTATKFCKPNLDFDGVSYIPLGSYLELYSDKKDIFVVDNNLIQMCNNCKIYGNVEKIENFDVFIKNFVKVDVSKSHVKNKIEKAGFEFNLSCGGNQSKLEIKPSDGSVGCEEVEIPDELIPFLADIDVFDVDSNIKTVRYDLLRTEDTLKKSAVPNGVKFEQINS